MTAPEIIGALFTVFIVGALAGYLARAAVEQAERRMEALHPKHRSTTWGE